MCWIPRRRPRGSNFERSNAPPWMPLGAVVFLVVLYIHNVLHYFYFNLSRFRFRLRVVSRPPRRRVT